MKEKRPGQEGSKQGGQEAQGHPLPQGGLLGNPVLGLSFVIQGMTPMSPELVSFTNTFVSVCPIRN